MKTIWKQKWDDNITMNPPEVLCSIIPIRIRCLQSKDEENVRQINTSTHQPKLDVLCCWWPIIASFRRWEAATPRPPLITWYMTNIFPFIDNFLSSFQFLFSHSMQISLIDRVHKIYNDTVWQDRTVSLL